jgi:hypothetical protein
LLYKLKKMETAIHQSITTVYSPAPTRTSLYRRFINWCAGQEEYRFGWLGAALVAHGCLFTPLTMFSLILSGNNIFMWVLAIMAMMMTLVTNLAALPAKITIPVFLSSILMDITIITTCAFTGFNYSGAFL